MIKITSLKLLDGHKIIKNVVLLNGEYYVDYSLSGTFIVEGFWSDGVAIVGESSRYQAHAFKSHEIDVDSSEYGDSTNARIGSRSSKMIDESDEGQIWRAVSEKSKKILLDEISKFDDKAVIKSNLTKYLSKLA